MTFRFSLPLFVAALGLVSSHAAAPFGYTEPYREVKMAFPEPGVISELPVKEGQAVKQGDVLARQNYQVYQKDLEIARAELKMQGTRLRKLKDLAKEARVSPDELDRASTDFEVSNLKAGRTEAQIENLTLRSPFDGIISEVKKEISESVTPAVNVLTLVELNRLIVKMYLPPEQAYKLQTGKEYELYLPDTKEKITALIEFISPVNDAASNTVRVKFVIPNATGTFKSGVRCELPDSLLNGITPPAPAAPGMEPKGDAKKPVYQ